MLHVQSIVFSAINCRWCKVKVTLDRNGPNLNSSDNFCCRPNTKFNLNSYLSSRDETYDRTRTEHV